MNKLFFLLCLAGIISLSSCTNPNLKSVKQNPNVLSELHEMMTGKFSSAEQATNDTLFYDISLQMFPIWEGDEDTKWLYVEQAVTKNIKEPYRQRVYRLNMVNDSIVESSVFELNAPAKFIHAWNNPEVFNSITPDSLMVREGCAVYLQQLDDCFVGSTKDKDCKSTMGGASYATSKVSICKDMVVSWDQGWNDAEEQVWGAETAGYIFKRIVEEAVN